ncbi:MAG: hypothetical protein ACU0A4_09355 [Paracoccaceae bacterium]
MIMGYSYDINRNWSDQFIPEIKRIVGAQLLKVASPDVDRREATDLLLLNAADLRIAARVRRPGYAERYPHQFTIRSRLPSGATTELSKIVDGYGDWMFYGHASGIGSSLRSWRLIDLKAFRAGLIRQANGQQILSGDTANPDGTYFKWFDVRSFPKDLIVAQS